MCLVGLAGDSVEGCTSECTIETGWSCAANSCGKCGNGKLEAAEECDDGAHLPACYLSLSLDLSHWLTAKNFQSKSSIQFPASFVCSVAQLGKLHVNWNGEYTGDMASGDGCGPECQIEEAFACVQQLDRSKCTPIDKFAQIIQQGIVAGQRCANHSNSATNQSKYPSLITQFPCV